VSESKAYDLVSGTAAQVASFHLRAAGWSVAVIDHLPEPSYPDLANAGPPRWNFAVRIGVGKGTAAAPIGVRFQHGGGWGRRRWRGHCCPQDRAHARHGLVGGFNAHITGSRLRQTISVFCSPGDRPSPAMQFFRPQNCGAVPGGLLARSLASGGDFAKRLGLIRRR